MKFQSILSLAAQLPTKNTASVLGIGVRAGKEKTMPATVYQVSKYFPRTKTHKTIFEGTLDKAWDTLAKQAHCSCDAKLIRKDNQRELANTTDDYDNLMKVPIE